MVDGARALQELLFRAHRRPLERGKRLRHKELKEGIRTAKKCKKVAYRPERLKNYLAIELELLAGTFLYVYEFAVRQIEKKAASDKS